MLPLLLENSFIESQTGGSGLDKKGLVSIPLDISKIPRNQTSINGPTEKDLKAQSFVAMLVVPLIHEEGSFCGESSLLMQLDKLLLNIGLILLLLCR